jgi:hypothetical protein
VNLSLQDMPIQIEHKVQWTGRAHPIDILTWSLPQFPDAAGNEIFVVLNTTEAEYVPLSVRSSMASQTSDGFTLS